MMCYIIKADLESTGRSYSNIFRVNVRNKLSRKLSVFKQSPSIACHRKYNEPINASEALDSNPILTIC